MDHLSQAPTKMSESQQFEFFENSLENVAKLYQDSKTADVHFTFESPNDGAETRIDAHKSLLAATSDVFGAMFYGELKETGDIHVDDVSDAAFKEFLQYFYQCKVKLTAENIAEVMSLGDKYNVTKCVEDCITFLKRKLNSDNICTALFYADLHGETELLELCRNHISSNTEEVFKSPGFLNCHRQVLQYILNLDFVSCSEDKVFDACMTWVKANSEQGVLSKELVDSCLGDLFYKIRFASMTIQQLCALQKKYDLVLSNDFITIVNIIAKPGVQTKKFVTTPRQIKWNKNDVIKFDRKTNGNFYPFDLYANYKTTLSSNVPLVLGSFVCAAIVIADGCGGHDLDWNLSVEVKITETSNFDSEDTKVKTQMKASLGSTMTKVLLPQPILIRPGFQYAICFGPFPCEHQYRTKLLKRKIRLTSGAMIKIHDNHDDDVDEDDDEAFGLIVELDFNRI